jgi:hypothetical protein
MHVGYLAPGLLNPVSMRLLVQLHGRPRLQLADRRGLHMRSNAVVNGGNLDLRGGIWNRLIGRVHAMVTRMIGPAFQAKAFQ